MSMKHNIKRLTPTMSRLAQRECIWFSACIGLSSSRINTQGPNSCYIETLKAFNPSRSGAILGLNPSKAVSLAQCRISIVSGAKLWADSAPVLYNQAWDPGPNVSITCLLLNGHFLVPLLLLGLVITPERAASRVVFVTTLHPNLRYK